MRKAAVALVCGVLFGAGLAVSGMADPARVRAFLDVSGAWDPTLAFVMAGAILPMAVAWRVARHRGSPVATARRAPIDAALLGGAAIFGIGWGLAGLCPGPALALLAIRPLTSAVFVSAMALGVAACRLISPALTRPPFLEPSR